MANVEKSGKVASISYHTAYWLEVKLDSGPETFIAEDTINQTAVDIAMMRDLRISLEIDENAALIRRVEVIEAAQPSPPIYPPAYGMPGDVAVTRVSSQVSGAVGRTFCEIFFQRGTAPEQVVMSFDPVVARLAGSALLVGKPVGLVLDSTHKDLVLGISKVAI